MVEFDDNNDSKGPINISVCAAAPAEGNYDVHPQDIFDHPGDTGYSMSHFVLETFGDNGNTSCHKTALRRWYARRHKVFCRYPTLGFGEYEFSQAIKSQSADSGAQLARHELARPETWARNMPGNMSGRITGVVEQAHEFFQDTLKKHLVQGHKDKSSAVSSQLQYTATTYKTNGNRVGVELMSRTVFQISQSCWDSKAGQSNTETFNVCAATSFKLKDPEAIYQNGPQEPEEIEVHARIVDTEGVVPRTIYTLAPSDTVDLAGFVQGLSKQSLYTWVGKETKSYVEEGVFEVCNGRPEGYYRDCDAELNWEELADPETWMDQRYQYPLNTVVRHSDLHLKRFLSKQLDAPLAW